MLPTPVTETVSFAHVDAEDEFLAVLYHFPLLISGRCGRGVTTVAQRVHAAAFGPDAPFITFPASALSERREQFAEQWSSMVLAGHGGSLLITSVEEMPIPTQAFFAESLDQLRATRPLVVRVIAGTAVSLLERVSVGHFSGDLLYRLNAIHLQRRDACQRCEECGTGRTAESI